MSETKTEKCIFCGGVQFRTEECADHHYIVCVGCGGSVSLAGTGVFGGMLLYNPPKCWFYSGIQKPQNPLKDE